MAGKSKIVKGALGQIVDLADWLTGKKKFYPEKEGPGIHDSLSEQKVFAENIDFFRAAQAAKTKKEKEAVRKKGKVLWLQYGIHHDEAEKIADQANINFISNKCIKQEYQRLFLKSNPVFPLLKN